MQTPERAQSDARHVKSAQRPRVARLKREKGGAGGVVRQEEDGAAVSAAAAPATEITARRPSGETREPSKPTEDALKSDKAVREANQARPSPAPSVSALASNIGKDSSTSAAAAPAAKVDAMEAKREKRRMKVRAKRALLKESKRAEATTGGARVATPAAASSRSTVTTTSEVDAASESPATTVTDPIPAKQTSAIASKPVAPTAAQPGPERLHASGHSSQPKAGTTRADVQKAQEEYRDKLANDPSFTPNKGRFWGHDDRFTATRGASRGRGRGRGRGRAQSAVYHGLQRGDRADAGPTESEGAWNHDRYKEDQANDAAEPAVQKGLRQSGRSSRGSTTRATRPAGMHLAERKSSPSAPSHTSHETGAIESPARRSFDTGLPTPVHSPSLQLERDQQIHSPPSSALGMDHLTSVMSSMRFDGSEAWSAKDATYHNHLAPSQLQPGPGRMRYAGFVDPEPTQTIQDPIPDDPSRYAYANSGDARPAALGRSDHLNDHRAAALQTGPYKTVDQAHLHGRSPAFPRYQAGHLPLPNQALSDVYFDQGLEVPPMLPAQMIKHEPRHPYVAESGPPMLPLNGPMMQYYGYNSYHPNHIHPPQAQFSAHYAPPGPGAYYPAAAAAARAYPSHPPHPQMQAPSHLSYHFAGHLPEGSAPAEMNPVNPAMAPNGHMYFY